MASKPKAREGKYVTTKVFRKEIQGLREEIHSSIELLAEAVRQGFEATDGKIEAVRAELKGDIGTFRGEFRSKITQIDNRWYRQQEMIDENKLDIRTLAKRTAVVEAELGIAPA